MKRLELRTGTPRITLTRVDEDSAVILKLPPQGPAGRRGLPGEGLEGPPGQRGEQGPRGAPGDTTVKVVGASGVQATLTGTSAETALATIVLPAGQMGANGRLRVVALWTCTNSGNNKTVRIRFGGIGGTIYHEDVQTTVSVIKTITEIDARGSASSQVGKPKDMISYGTSTNALVTSSIDTNAGPTDIALTAQLANTGETIRLEAYVVELMMPPLQADIGLYYGDDGVIIDDDFRIHIDWDLVAALNSPLFTGAPRAPTAADGTNTTQIATTAFVHSLINALSTVYLTADPDDARTALGLGALALLN